ncbi:MAG: hypothetical protein GX247_03255 [Mollicutes bacterium]|mgnify:CR=1 FL=1|jgi:hypothetical protein|nr:hypothetical protein [Mollicutes bacterium]
MGKKVDISDLFDKKTEISKPKKNMSKAVIVFVILDFLAIICLFLIYGPIDYFRNLWITTAMKKMNHKYLARVLYSEKTIQHVLANNYVIESAEDTDISTINIGDNEDPGIYESIYEEQILKRDPEQPDYKIIDIEGINNYGLKYKGYLVVIYDPGGYGKVVGEFIQGLPLLKEKMELFYF